MTIYHQPRPNHQGGVLPLTSPLRTFETSAEAETRRTHRVRLLSRGGPEDLPAADVLAGCVRRAPCERAACPVCMLEFRRQWTSSLESAFEHHSNLLFVTIVPQEGRVAAGELAKFELKRWINTTRQRIRRASIPDLRVAGYADFTHDDETGQWQVHLHLVVAGAEKDELRSVLARHYPSSVGVYRPLVILPISDRPGAFSYTAKSFWQRKVTYQSPAGRKTSRLLPLRPVQERELLTYLSQYRTTDLMLLIGLRVGAAGNLIYRFGIDHHLRAISVRHGPSL